MAYVEIMTMYMYGKSFSEAEEYSICLCNGQKGSNINFRCRPFQRITGPLINQKGISGDKPQRPM